MKVTELLQDQHKEVERIFKSIEKADNEGQKIELFEMLANNLMAHEIIERELFYPACEREIGMTDLLGESLVEHGVVEFSLYRACQALGEDDFEYKMTVLEHIVKHHIKQEENELFPEVEKAFNNELLRDLGVQLQTRFEKAKSDGFRGILENNLRQVLAGTDKLKASNGTKRKAIKQETSVLRVR